MAQTMYFDLVSPEKRLASLEASEVCIPGIEGDMTAMPHHAPVITTLRPGILSATGPEGSVAFVVSGGFAQIGVVGVSILAERAYPKEGFSQDTYSALLEEVREALTQAPPERVDSAAKTVADMQDIGKRMGLSA